MTTPILALPEWAAAQASPWVPHNLALRYLEQGAMWFRFIDRDLTAPPGSPADGDCYLVATGGTGAWSGHDGDIAVYLNTAWVFIEALEGMGAGVLDENVAVAFLGGAWVELAADGGGVSPGSIVGSGLTMNTNRLLGRTTASSGDIEEIAPGTGILLSGGVISAVGGGSAWTLAGGGYTAPGVWDQSVDGTVTEVIFNNLGAYSEVYILATAVTKSVSGTLFATASIDNGSTFYTASGDYIAQDSDGVETNASVLGGLHLTNATAARGGAISVNFYPVPVALFAGSVRRYFAGSASPINALRIYPSSAGNLTGGKIRCFVR